MRRPIVVLAWAGLAACLLAGPAAAAPSNEDCVTCHGDKTLKAADGRSLFVESEALGASIHGQAGLSCVDCHVDLKAVKDFPHAEKLKPVNCAACHDKPAAELRVSVHRPDRRTAGRPVPSCSDCHGSHDVRAKDDFASRVFPLNLPGTCERCHEGAVKTGRGTAFIKGYDASVHFRALEKSGLTLSANCSDCHGSHAIKSMLDPASRVSRGHIIPTCGRCHVGIERDYLEGVHGKDYTKGIKDVPVCTDCHSEHRILSPRSLGSSVYATNVAAVCSRCHDDEALSRQYGFITSRMKSYTNSFHGTASKFGETRVANCASCHGFHDIRPSLDPKSPINPANLARTCGQCHAGAGKNFARGKIHVVSQKVSNRSAHVVKTFYLILITVVISVCLIFIAADFFHRLSRKWKK
jgi:predicted CXXCH cytochrome family protein